MTILAFTDTETTGLDPRRHEIWEIAVIRREEDGTETEHLWQIRPPDWHLRFIADPEALEIGRYHERIAVPGLAQAADMLDDIGDGQTPVPLDILGLAERVAQALKGAVLVGSNSGFDAAFLDRLLGLGKVPWHYRPTCIANLAEGYLWRDRPEVMAQQKGPLSSRWLSQQMGVELPAADVAHTALGDARWAKAVFDAVTNLPREHTA